MNSSEPWHQPVLQFWFDTVGEPGWFTSSPALDAEIRSRFAALHRHLSSTSLNQLGSMPLSCLAAIVVLDQFARNMFRGTPRAFATDPQALSLAQQMVASGLDRPLATRQRLFIYLPYQHSEDLAVQVLSLQLFAALADPAQLSYAQQHHEIIARFGRFPHRNFILGRGSTAEELQFLQHHSGF